MSVLTARTRPSVVARGWVLALPAVVCSAILGLYQLGDPSLWIDEAVTARATGRDYSRLWDEMWWAHYTVLKTWTIAVGTSETALRLPSVVGAVVAVALLWGLARKLVGERTASLAALLLAVNPFFVKWSQQARGYTIVVALAIAATWLLLRALERNTLAAWLPYGLVLVALLHWHMFSGFLLLAVHLVLAWRSRPAVLALGASLLVSAPWLLNFATRGESELPTAWIPARDVQYVLTTAGYLSGATGFGLVLAAVGIVLLRDHRRLLVAWACLPFALALVASLVEPVFVDRYLIISCPALAILGAVALTDLAERWRTSVLAAAVIGTFVGLALWYSPDGDDNWAGENWKAATALVMEHGGGQAAPKDTSMAFTYYGGRVAKTRWVIEFGRRGFAPSPYVRETFGSSLRVLQLPVRRPT